MKNFFAQLFGKRSTPVAPAPSKPVKSEPDIAMLRQQLESATTVEERAARAALLGQQLGKREIEPAANDTADVWIFAVCACALKTQAADWLANIQDEAALEQVASKARLADIRLMAAQKITDIERIGRLAHQMRDRDRGVYRHCQGLLKQHADQAHRAGQVEGLHRQFMDLIASQPIASGMLYELRKQLAALSDGPDLEPCHALSRQAGEAAQEEVAQLRTLEELASEANGLLQNVSKGVLADLDQLKNRAHRLSAQVSALPGWTAGQSQRVQVANKLQLIVEKLCALEEDERRFAACRSFLESTAGQAFNQALTDTWNQLSKPDDLEVRQSLETEWLKRGGQPVPRAIPRKVVKPPQSIVDADRFRQRLDELEEALAAGRSQEALSLARALDEMAAEASPPQALVGRHHALQAQVGQVRDLLRWSTQQARDHLVEEAEALMAEGVTRVHVAEAVPRLRAEWKRLDKLSRGSQSQWQQFDQALNHAYQPILAERAERNARQDAISQSKSALLDEAEQWLQGLSPEAINPGELQGQRQALRNHWRGMVQAGPRDERQLQNRFHALMRDLDEKIQPFVQAEIDRRQRLLNTARLLHQEPDLRAAIDQARHLQQQWRGTNNLHLPRQVNEKLWQSFKEAVDGVFARRDAERKQHDAESQERNAGRRAQLKALEILLESRPGQAQLEAGIGAFQEQWNEEPTTEGRRPRRDDLDQQADSLLRRARSVLKEWQSARQWAVLDQIEQKAAWARDREVAVLANGDADGVAGLHIQALWHEAASLSPDLEQKLRQRFERAPQITPLALEAGRTERDRRLIDLEILLDLPTPSAWMNQRRLRQLELLQTDFKSMQLPSVLLGLFADWYAVSAADDLDQAGRIVKIKDKLIALLSQ